MHDLDGSNSSYTPAQLKFIKEIDSASMLESNFSLIDNATDQKFEVEVEHNSNEKPLVRIINILFPDSKLHLIWTAQTQCSVPHPFQEYRQMGDF